MTATATRILLLGGGGQVGQALTPLLASRGMLLAPTPTDTNLLDGARLRDRVLDLEPRIIINAAAYTAVDQAETERDAAHAVNATAPGILAGAARELDALLVHYSTDYVFDGTKRSAYLEDDTTHPLSVYGQSKRAGELQVLDSGAKALVLRTSWVYSLVGQNFLLTVRRLAREQPALRIVDDQRASPTWSGRIAHATLSVLDRLESLPATDASHALGLYHMSALGAASWYDFARAIVADDPTLSAFRGIPIEPIATSAFPRPAARPRYSLLDCSRLEREFEINLGPWREGLREALGLSP